MPDVTAELPSQSTQTRTCTAPSRRAQIDEPDEATRVSAALGQSQLFQSGAPSGLQSMLVEVLWRSYPPNGHEAPLLDAQTQQVARGADEAADYADEPPKRRYHCLLGHALLHEEGAIGPRVHVLRLGARVVARLLRCVGLLVRRSAICVSGQRGGRWAGNLDLHSTLHALWAHHVHEHAAHVGLEGLPRPHACGDDHVVHLLLRLRRLRWRWLQLLLGHDQRRLWG
mmetsp:Transcript_15780/g.42420  ORF Transcript_15780/g.42420 Transcript_15780/m.42420 type:complete len:227 (+) Transcript_15780:60-740(+)